MQSEGGDFWVKVVGMLEQNWALIVSEPRGAHIHFINDLGEVFDKITCSSQEEARSSLARNGFRRFARDKQLQRFLSPPAPPFSRGTHPNGAIYSSGRFRM